MNETELKQKMNNLGNLMKLKQYRQEEFDQMNQDLDSRIDELKSELKKEFLKRQKSESNGRTIPRTGRTLPGSHSGR